MQALSQLSYGPALLLAGNHSGISTPWEVFFAKSCTERAAKAHAQSASIFPQKRAPGVRQALLSFSVFVAQ
ncbi:hypothetical protein XbrCFBP1976_17490 [Xanthomonas bromi]|uniref:Uncharacterized protein n=1 Tax=Xanthomonas bromi TaxID=56449 RepID=A0ABX5BL68_9XANT|nr:hypothetical protein XbrCFBP1976_17490 [Xanthomonas bromi]